MFQIFAIAAETLMMCVFVAQNSTSAFKGRQGSRSPRTTWAVTSSMQRCAVTRQQISFTVARPGSVASKARVAVS
jgi:hypothetical protein